MSLQDYLNQNPIIAILRGIRLEDVPWVADILIEAGICIIEIPLNSPQPFQSIQSLVTHAGNYALVGAGTVTSLEECHQLIASGGQLMVAPNCNPEIIKQAKQQGLIVLPGVATPTEAFQAIHAGADALKIFPINTLGGCAVLKAWSGVLPQNTLLIPVGGVDSSNIKQYLNAGAHGVGLSSSLYQPGMSPHALKENTHQLLAAL